MSKLFQTTFLVDVKRNSCNTVYVWAPFDLFMSCSHQYAVYPYMRPSAAEIFYILCELGPQTEHHLSSTQTACYQQKQTKNCVTSLM